MRAPPVNSVSIMISKRIYSDFKVIEAGIFFRLLFGNAMVVIQPCFTNFDTHVSHMLIGLFTNCDI